MNPSPESEHGKTLIYFSKPDTRKLVGNVDAQIKPLINNLDKAAGHAVTAITQAKGTLVSLEDSVGEDSSLMYELNEAVKEFSGAARSIRLLADYLTRHPESLLKGKEGESEQWVTQNYGSLGSCFSSEWVVEPPNPQSFTH